MAKLPQLQCQRHHPTGDSLAAALSHTNQPEVAARARAVAAAVRTDGAEIAARRLIDEVSRRALGNKFPQKSVSFVPA